MLNWDLVVIERQVASLSATPYRFLQGPGEVFQLTSLLA